MFTLELDMGQVKQQIYSSKSGMRLCWKDSKAKNVVAPTITLVQQ